MKIGIIFMFILGMYQCTPIEELEEDSISYVKPSYPRGPYGYKASVREIDDEYIIDRGDTFPDMFIIDENNFVYSTYDLYLSQYEYITFIIGTDDCVPCEMALSDIEDIRYELSIWNMGVIYTHLNKTEDNLWLYDKWPEIMRGYPTFLVISTKNMRVTVEQVGYGLPKWYEIIDKIDFYIEKEK